MKWYKPTRAQAGAQKGRDCIEQILVIRLLCDYVKKTRKKLYLLFIDFEKAYDKVPRKKLFEELEAVGCGQVFLRILCSIYSCTKLIFQSAVIIATCGVRQGAATSVLLFVIYIDRMVKMINEKSVPDDFLKNLHVLLLMDDAILLATSRERLIQKLKIVVEYCHEYGMSVNLSKTKFMVINGTLMDFADINLAHLKIKHCDHYIYLGSPITSEATYKSIVEKQVEEKMKHYIKFCIFLNKNPDFPFSIKKKVEEACLFASILYGCETWLCNTFGEMETIYMKVVKSLLDVRTNTCNDLSLLESGMPSIKAVIKDKRSKYFRKKIPTLLEFDPLNIAINLAKSVNTASSKVIDEALQEQEHIKSQCR